MMNQDPGTGFLHKFIGVRIEVSYRPALEGGKLDVKLDGQTASFTGDDIRREDALGPVVTVTLSRPTRSHGARTLTLYLPSERRMGSATGLAIITTDEYFEVGPGYDVKLLEGEVSQVE
jgi:hypothetical protein